MSVTLTFSDLSDSEGILAFEMRRRGLDYSQIGAALHRNEQSVRKFFTRYPVYQPWSRRLRVPDGWTPEVISELVTKALASA